jgi:transposase
MRLETILHRVEKYRSFVYGSAWWEAQEGGVALVVPVRPRRCSRPVCSGCGARGPPYDRLAERRFEYVPLWGLVVFFAYRMRRVNCPQCGVTVERVPWCDGSGN